MARALALVILAACSDPRPEIAKLAAPSPATPVMPPGPRRWIPGDLHVHPAPFDVREGASLTVADIDALGPGAGLEWAIITPHVRPPTWDDPTARAHWLAQWTQLATEARAAPHLTLIPGAEWTIYGYGHFGISGVDLATLGKNPNADTAAKGGFVVVNHPYAVPMHLAGIPVSEIDLSFHPWSEGKGLVPHLDGVEVWNVPLAVGDVLAHTGKPTGEDRAFAAADALARAEHRPIAIVGGSDTHTRMLLPTTWVLAPDAREGSIFAALHAGATCVGGPAAGSLEARGDSATTWAAIGETTHATAKVELRWTGRAHLFIDGLDAGEHDAGFTHDHAAGTHTYRITIGASRCGFVYANL